MASLEPEAGSHDGAGAGSGIPAQILDSARRRINCPDFTPVRGSVFVCRRQTSEFCRVVPWRRDAKPGSLDDRPRQMAFAAKPSTRLALRDSLIKYNALFRVTCTGLSKLMSQTAYALLIFIGLTLLLDISV
jgi:hypothetical protein